MPLLEDFQDAFGGPGNLGLRPRERLTTDRVYYVNPNAGFATPGGPSGSLTLQPGSDGNNGLTIATPFLTMQKAWDTAAALLDLGGRYRVIVYVGNATVSQSAPFLVASGSLTGGCPVPASFPGAGTCPIVFVGNIGSPASVNLTTTGSLPALLVNGAMVAFEGFKVSAPATHCMQAGAEGEIQYGTMIFGTSGAAKVFSGNNSCIEAYANSWITGDCVYVFASAANASILVGNYSHTLLGNVTATAFAYCDHASSLIFNSGATFPLNGFTFTGARYLVLGGKIDVSGGGATFFPGTTPGTTASGGIYDNLPLQVSAGGLGLSDTTLVPYSPAVDATVGAITTVGAVTGRYVKIGKLVFFKVDAIITTNGTGAQWLRISLPVPATADTCIISGREGSGTNKALIGYIFNGDTSRVRTSFYDGTYPGADGREIVMSGIYEAAS